MENKDKAFVIIGEASESEDEGNIVLSTALKIAQREHASPALSKNKGIIVVGEASESESESEEACREAFFARSGVVQNSIDEDQTDTETYDSLLHKKLRECNASLHSSIVNHSRNSLLNAVRAVNTTNQQLLVTQIQVQDTVSALCRALDNLKKLNDNLESLLATPYIPEINNV